MSGTTPVTLSTLTRHGTWWNFKLPPILFLVYLLIPATDRMVTDALVLIALVVWVIASAASYGHVVNDCFDAESDTLAGKPNVAVGMTLSKRLGFLVLFAASGFLPLMLAAASTSSFFLLGGIYLSVTLYSAPPIRTKERGWLGPLFDAAAAHALPCLLVFSLVGHTPHLLSTHFQIAVAAAVAWQLCFGLRAILVHQVLDRGADERSDTQTLVLTAKPGRLEQMAGLMLLIEVPTLLFLLWMFYPLLPIVLWFTMAYFMVALTWHLGFGKSKFDLLPQVTNSRIPMFELYEFFLPLVGVIAVALYDPAFWPLPLLHVLLFHGRFVRGVKLVCDTFRSRTGAN